METLLDGAKIDQLMKKMADDIGRSIPPNESLCLVGIRSRGEVLAQRLQKLLQKRGLQCPDLGAMDITLYRDDLSRAVSTMPVIQATEINFDISNRIVILVDDVLNTGRSVRAALSFLVDLGRPKAIRLAVLIDRGNRELPICADFVGVKLDVPQDKTIKVHIHEADSRDEVILE